MKKVCVCWYNVWPSVTDGDPAFFKDDFLKMLPKFKMAARGQFQKKCVGAHYSPYGLFQGDFFKISLKFEMAAMHGSTLIFGGARKLEKCVWSILFKF